MSNPIYLSHASNITFGDSQKISNKYSPVDNTLTSSFQDDPIAVTQAIEFLAQGRKKVLKLTADDLKNIISEFIKNIDARANELANMISQETGKVLWDAKSEVTGLKAKALQSLEQWNAQKIIQLNEALPGVRGEVRDKPLGIVSVLGPFNFPMHLPNGQIIPAILKGNSILFKPSELTPGCAELYCQLWWASGLPPEAMALVQGQREVGVEATVNPKINGIFFTGSLPTGIAIQKAISTTPQKILALEMGGVNPLVIWNDAHIEAAAHAAITGFCLTTGQRCTATRRIMIHRDVYSKTKAEILKLVRKIKPGLPTENVFCGPLISAASKNKFYSARKKLIESGSILIYEHSLNESLPDTGGFVPPSILEGGDIASFVKEETFAPLVVLEPIMNMDNVLDKCSWSPYGLSASIFTQQESIFQEFWAGVNSGLINWNQPTNGASGKLPFGGVGLSGNHRPAGADMINHCFDKVSSLINPSPENLLKTNYPGLSD